MGQSYADCIVIPSFTTGRSPVRTGGMRLTCLGTADWSGSKEPDKAAGILTGAYRLAPQASASRLPEQLRSSYRESRTNGNAVTPGSVRAGAQTIRSTSCADSGDRGLRYHIDDISHRPPGLTCQKEAPKMAAVIEDPELKKLPEMKVFGFEDCMDLMGNSIEMVTMTMENFLQSEPDSMQKIVQLMSQDPIDFGKTRNETHSLKGSSSYVCAQRLSHTALQMQRASEAKNAALLRKQFPILQQEFRVATDAIKKRLDEIRASS